MGMGAAAGGAFGAQLAGLMMLPEILEKEHAKTQCSICGRKVPIKTVIERDGKLLCEQCYEKEYGSRQKKRR